MSHAGNNLRTRLKKQFDEDLVCKTMQQFVDFQIQAADYVDDLIAMGVPDYRLDQLPGLYDALVADTVLLAEEGFSETEIAQFQGQSPQVVALCRKLSSYGVKPSVVQLDFNDNNTLIDDTERTITMIDLGEIVIKHPFVSLLNFLEQMGKHYGVTKQDAVYQQLQRIPFVAYADFFPHADDFHDALATAGLVYLLCGAIYQVRFAQACGKENLKQHHQWKLKALLNHFSEALQ